MRLLRACACLFFSKYQKKKSLITAYFLSVAVTGGISGVVYLWVSGISCSLDFLCEKQGASLNGKVAQWTARPLSSQRLPIVYPPALWAPSWLQNRCSCPQSSPPRLLPPSPFSFLWAFLLSFLCLPPSCFSPLPWSSSIYLSHVPSCPFFSLSSSFPRLYPKAANEEPHLAGDFGSVRSVAPAGLGRRDWLLRLWHHTGASCWFGAVSKAGWLDGLWQVSRILSLSRSRSLCDTHTPSSSPFTLSSPCLPPSLSGASVQEAAAEERAGRWLQPPLQQIVPPVQWKLSGRIAERMEGRAARQVRPAALWQRADMM